MKPAVRKVVRKVLSSFKFYEEALETGRIISVKDGVARVNGLFGVLSGEMVYLGIAEIQGMVLSLEHNTVSVVIFGNDTLLKQGDLVYRTFVIMNIPLSIKLFGRVIDALGNTIDGGKKVVASI
jgi:F0F1-type ATP synthase alpha subunit